METHGTIRYRIHAGTADKYQGMYGLSGACRYVWNHYVGHLREEFQAYGEIKSYRWFTLGKYFTHLRKHNCPWLQTYSSSIVRLSLKPIQTAYAKFYRGDSGLPKFKSKWNSDPSFPVYFGLNAKMNGSWLHIRKIGYVKLIGENPYENAIPKSGAVKEENGKWYAYIAYAIEAIKKPRLVKAAGLDRNDGQVALSDGRIFYAPDVERKERGQKNYQKMMARRHSPNRRQGIKPSNRCQKAKGLKRNFDLKIKHVNDNWNYGVSKTIANDYDVVYIEDLKTKNMTALGKGDTVNPDRNVKSKSGLNRVILNTGWHKLEQMLAYKMTVKKVPPHYTSQTCSCCGCKDRQNRISQSKYKCLKCGHSDNADINAAENILAFGNKERLNGRVDSAVKPTVKHKKESNVNNLTVV